MLDFDTENKIEQLIAKMSLEEKIGQLNLLSPTIVGGFELPFEELIELMTDGKISTEEFRRLLDDAEKDSHEEEIVKGQVGSLMGTYARQANELQKLALNETRLGIPLLFGLDVIHGYRTIFPIPLAESCSFDRELWAKTAHISAVESTSDGVNWHYAPMIDVSRDARWGRISEGAGEDPYLVAEYAVSKVRALQENENPEYRVAACPKHFVGYGAAESGRDYNTTSISTSELYNVYLLPFIKAVQAGAKTMMASFNDINGVPTTTNKHLLRDLLKEKFDFSGFVVSDANAIQECIEHGTVSDEAGAGKEALTAGVDIDMASEIYSRHMVDLVKQGRIEEALIDDSVQRVLRVKFALGLFENAYVSSDRFDSLLTLPLEHRKVAKEAALKSIVLLKNDNEILPLNKSMKISLVGALADDAEEVVGAWTLRDRKEDSVSIVQGFEQNNITYRYFPCSSPESAELIDEDIENAGRYGDVIVAVVGETKRMSGEAASRSYIGLPGAQQDMLRQLKEFGKPIVLVLMNGRPLALEWEDSHIDAILESWQLGSEMGNAVVDILLGECSPEGKLTCSFPRVTGQSPIYYNHVNTGRPAGKSKFTSKYIDVAPGPLYPFGYGLSYTNYEYSNLQVEEVGDALKVMVDVENIGSRPGNEIVQLYIRDHVAKITRPVKELKGFQKLAIEPGRSVKAKFSLAKYDLGFYDNEANYCLEDGEFSIMVGGNSADVLVEKRHIEFPSEMDEVEVPGVNNEY